MSSKFELKESELHEMDEAGEEYAGADDEKDRMLSVLFAWTLE